MCLSKLFDGYINHYPSSSSFWNGFTEDTNAIETNYEESWFYVVTSIDFSLGIKTDQIFPPEFTGNIAGTVNQAADLTLGTLPSGYKI